MRGAVTEIILDRPEKRNAISAALERQFVAALADFDADPDARVAIVMGRDPACAGMDLNELGHTGSSSAAKPPSTRRYGLPRNR